MGGKIRSRKFVWGVGEKMGHHRKKGVLRKPLNAATKLIYEPINFYHEGALLVYRESLGTSRS